MSALEKARLEVVDGGGNVTDSVPVQFNPTTMSLQMSNSNDGGSSRGRQTQQYNGSSSTTLTLDLEFDTADEGTTDRPVDVRTLTAGVRQFVLPGAAASKQAPPRVKFRWGTFELTGVMATLTEELSLFSSGGVPLRAKVSVQIKEQDPQFDALERGPGANADSGAPAAGELGLGITGGVGTSGGGLFDASASALFGETAADFLARNGLAPEGWRALGGALDALSDGIELEAGFSVEFDSSLTVGSGLGLSAGFSAGLDVPLGASLGLEAGSSSSSSGGSPVLAQGFALSSAGGLTAASEAAKATTASSAADAARAEFGAGASPRATGAAGSPARAPLTATPVAGSTRAAGASPNPSPPKADPRATSFGRGVPLRDRVVPPGSEREGYVVVGRSAPTDLDARSRRPGRAAPWEALAPGAGRDIAEREQGRRRPSCGCGGACGGSAGGSGGGCRCGGGCGA